MVKIKAMPFEERYAKVTDNMKFDESFILPFVQQHLGDQAVSDLKEIWQRGFRPIPDVPWPEKKYEAAYANWIWLAKNVYSFIRKRMGEEGIEKFERAEIDGLIRKNAGPDLLLLNLARVFSPATAFSMTAKQMGYQFQWLTPFSAELTRDKLVLDIPRCKILDFPDTEDICVVGCQSTYPAWVAEQFKIHMRFDRQGNSCKGTLTPLS